jgi:DNA gyrase subunit A
LSDDNTVPPKKPPTPPKRPALPPSGPGADIKPISIVEEMKQSFLGYAMSVIVSRALPDVRDGLKPVHRRILYAMKELGLDWNKKYVKSARVVGDVMGKYHPHGDLAIYDALVRMAQEWSLRAPLIDGQGNFGSVDGDSPAAMRYTECRLTKLASFLIDDLDKETVEFQDNYDGSESEPMVLPAKFPNLLVNGAGGIAVGMATNIPPHNLGEVIDGCLAYLDNPEITIDQLLEIVPGPDYPTGGQILGRAGIRAAFHKGRGSIVTRARYHVETLRKSVEAIIVTEIPYQVNKRKLIEKIAELMREKKIEGISNVWDESNRLGMRIVIEVRRDAMPDVVVNQLWRFTEMQSSFGVNMLALNGGKPEQMTLRDMIAAFCAFREDTVGRRTKYLLNKARDRAHTLVGLAIAVANIDDVIHLIRNAPNPAAAREGLMGRTWPAKDMAPLIALIADPRHGLGEDGEYRLSEAQAQAILDLRLQRLTGLGREEIGDELTKIGGEIKDYLDILSSRARIVEIIRGELTEIRDEFATPRRTEILDYEGDVDDEDLIQREDMVVTVSHKGYIKRVPLSAYRAQKRGGKGRSGMSTRDEDVVTRLFVANTHTPIIFFSSRGMAYKMKVYRLPLATPQALGKALVNLLPLEADERITTILPLPEDEASWETLDVMFATETGHVRRNRLSDFSEINRAGKIAMKLDEGDHILGVGICTGNDDVLLTTADGQAIRFAADDVRLFKGRDSTGVRGINLATGDKAISMTILTRFEATSEVRAAFLKRRRALLAAAAAAEGIEGEVAIEPEAPDADAGEEAAAAEVSLSDEQFAAMQAAEQFVLTVSRKGYGKRSSSFEYRVTNRGGKGIVGMIVNDRNGKLAACFPVEEKDQIMLVTDAGQLIRCPINGIRVAGRNTQGVRIFRTADDETIVSVEHIPEDENAEGEGEAGTEPEAGDATAGTEGTEA